MSEKKTNSRSDATRQRRRNQKSQARKKTNARRELPPITARGVVNDFALDRRIRSRKRRFNATLNLSALRANSLPIPRMETSFGWRWLSILLAILLGTALYLAWNSPYFRVSVPTVTGNQRIPAEEINAMLDLSGRPIFLLNPAQIETQAHRNYPELASVEVTVSLPNHVTVNVSERQPIIVWQQDGGYTWVDENGIAFRPRGEAQGLVVIQALSTPQPSSIITDDPDELAAFVPKDMVKAILTLAPTVPAGTPIVYEQVTGLSWNDPRGWTTVIGHDFEDMAVKVRVYQTMVDWLAQRGIQPILINVAYPDAPFYRLEQGDQ